MPTTRTQARNEMFQLLLDKDAALKASKADLAALEMRWQGIETPDEVENAPKTMAGKFWTRALTQVLLSRQSAHMMTDEPGGSPACWQTNGQLIVQVFAPRNVVDSYNTGDLLADSIAKIYRNAETASGVWFKEATAKEVTSENSFWRWNVFVEFQYDELQTSEAQLLNDLFEDNGLTVGGPNDGLQIVGDELRVDIGSLPLAPN